MICLTIVPLKKRVNRDKCSFATKQRMFGVFAIDEILRYRGTRFPGSRTLCHPGLAYLDVRLQSSGSDYALLQNYLRNLLEEVYGTAESEDLVGEKLRYLVTSWSCYLENSNCLDTARNLWDSWKQSSLWEYEVAPEDKGWAYCNGIRQVVGSAVCSVYN